jgi:hypothetical protein
MTNGQKYSITFHRFLRYFGIMAGDKDLRKLHDERELDKEVGFLWFSVVVAPHSLLFFLLFLSTMVNRAWNVLC